MSSDTQRRLDDRVEVYEAWVRELRQRSSPPPSVVDDALDPLSRFGRELHLLSTAIARREEELRKLFELVQTVESGVLLDEVLSRIFAGFSELIPFERIGCAFVSDDRSRLVAYWVRSELGPARIHRGHSLPMAGSNFEQMLDDGVPQIVNDLEAYLASRPDAPAVRGLLEEGGRAILTCPLVCEGRPLGFLTFTSAKAQTYSKAHQELFCQIAPQVALVIERSRVYEALIADNRRRLDRAQQLEHFATIDALTDVLNRRAIEQVLEEAWSEHQRRATPFGIILCDVDRFKTVNDQLGHPAGDKALRGVAQRMLSHIRKGDAVGRYGGDEFLLVIESPDASHLLQTAERLRHAISEQLFDLGVEYRVTASFGVAQVSAHTASVAALIERADRALYAGKSGGRNRSVLADTRSA